jgi:iron complex outermembrane receptor protein
MGSLMLGADVSYRTESYTNSPIDLTSPSVDAQTQEEHAIWNALAAWRSTSGKWRVAVEGKNLEDKRVVTNTFDLTVFQTAGYNMPRTWAVSLGYEF